MLFALRETTAALQVYVVQMEVLEESTSEEMKWQLKAGQGAKGGAL